MTLTTKVQGQAKLTHSDGHSTSVCLWGKVCYLEQSRTEGSRTAEMLGSGLGSWSHRQTRVKTHQLDASALCTLP